MERMKTLDEKKYQLSFVLDARDLQKLETIVRGYETCGEFTCEFYAWLYGLCDQKESDDEVLKIMLSCQKFDVNKTQNNGETILHALVRNNHYGWVQYLMKNFKKLNVNVACKKMKTPFLLAAEYGHIDILDFLEPNVEDIHCCDTKKFTVLHWVAKHGSLKWVKYLIEKKSFEVDQKNDYGDTPMNRAISFGQYECCQYLLKLGASPSQIDEDGRTLLHAAVFGENPTCLDEILNYVKEQSFINAIDNKGKTALNWAAGKGLKEMVLSLLMANSDVNITDNEGETALLWAAGLGHIEIVTSLLEANSDVNITDNEGKTALSWASGKGYIEIVTSLLKANSDVNITDNEGKTALLWASGKGHIEIVTSLLEANSDVNITDNEGKTALSWASGKGHIEIVTSLLKANSDVNIIDNKGMTPLLWAAVRGREDIVKLLIKAKANPNHGVKCRALKLSASKGHTKIVNILRNASANDGDGSGNSVSE